MKKIKKLLIALTAVALTMNFPMTTTEAAAKKADNSVTWQTKDGLDIMKTAKSIGDNKYEISLKVKGKPREIKNPADIILVMDNSGSMKNDMDNLKNAMTTFVNEVSSFYKDKGIPLNMSLIRFSGPEKYNGVYKRTHGRHSEHVGTMMKGSSSDAKLLYDSTKGVNSSKLNSEIKSVKAKGGTDTKAALELLNTELNKKKNDGHDKYVIFFTDGLPSALPNKALFYNYRGREDGSKVSYSNKLYGIAYDYYYTNKSSEDYYYNSRDWQALNNYYSVIPEHKNEHNQLSTAMYKMALPDTVKYMKDLNLKKNYGAKVFSIGLFKELKNSDSKKYANCLLNSLKNTPDPAYIIDNGANISSVYTNIENEIKQEYRVAEDTRITDFVPSNFQVVKGAYGDGKTSIISELNEDGHDQAADMDLSNIKQPKPINQKDGDSSLTWNIGEMTSNGIEIKFVIEPKDYYFGGQDIPTNTKAIIDFYDPLDPSRATKEDEFNIPNVDIPYKKGSVAVSKKLIDLDGKSVNSNNKEFTICLDGGNKGKYYIKVEANGQAKTMNFYMRDENTDISNNKDTSLNYLMVGEYTVKELDSLNCETKSININGKNVALNGAKFNVDKDNPNIKIQITNVEKNNTNYNDKDNKENDFGKLSLPANPN